MPEQINDGSEHERIALKKKIVRLPVIFFFVITPLLFSSCILSVFSHNWYTSYCSDWSGIAYLFFDMAIGAIFAVFEILLILAYVRKFEAQDHVTREATDEVHFEFIEKILYILSSAYFFVYLYLTLGGSFFALSLALSYLCFFILFTTLMKGDSFRFGRYIYWLLASFLGYLYIFTFYGYFPSSTSTFAVLSFLVLFVELMKGRYFRIGKYIFWLLVFLVAIITFQLINSYVDALNSRPGIIFGLIEGIFYCVGSILSLLLLNRWWKHFFAEPSQVAGVQDKLGLGE